MAAAQVDETALATLVARLRPHFTLSAQPGHVTVLRERHGELPPALRALWAEAAEWHLLPEDHFDVFGFNLRSPEGIEAIADDVFGGREGRRDWAARHGGGDARVSCADPGWACCFAFSEYDYLFVCLDSGNGAQHGLVRHVVNNCDEEEYCCTVEELIAHLADFVEEAKAKTDGGGVETVEEEEDGEAMLAGLNGPLRRMRSSIIDAVIEMMDN